MTVKESKAYSAMMVREFCYLFDMEKEGLISKEEAVMRVEDAEKSRV